LSAGAGVGFSSLAGSSFSTGLPGIGAAGFKLASL